MGQQACAVRSSRPFHGHSRSAWGSMRLHPPVADNTSAQYSSTPTLTAGTFKSSVGPGAPMSTSCKPYWFRTSSCSTALARNIGDCMAANRLNKSRLLDALVADRSGRNHIDTCPERHIYHFWEPTRPGKRKELHKTLYNLASPLLGTSQ